MRKIIYLAPDIDLSKNEGWKAHTLGEVKYLQSFFGSVFLIAKNSKNIALDKGTFRQVYFSKIPTFLHQPLFRITIENLYFIFLAIFLRIKWYKYLLERSYRLWGIFSIVFCFLGGKGIYQLNEPIYYEKFIMPFQNFLIKIMGHLDIKFFGTYKTFAYNLPKNKYINGRWWVDYENIPLPSSKKAYDIIYIWSIAGRHNMDLILNVAKKLKNLKFLLLVSGTSNSIIKKISDLSLDNITIIHNVSHDKIYDFISKSKIGLAIYEKNNEILQKFDYCYSPIKVHEYKACGIPVIASNCGTLIELVRDSWILINNNIDELKDAIETLLSNKDLYKKCAYNGIQETKEKYNRAYITKRYFTLLTK